MSTKTKTRTLPDFVPILQWLPSYNPGWLSADLIAGLSVWALFVPQAIACSSVIGVPAQCGLYTALAALIGYALFGTSKPLITGPSATVAAVSVPGRSARTSKLSSCLPGRELDLLNRVGTTEVIGNDKFFVTVRDTFTAIEKTPTATQGCTWCADPAFVTGG